MTPPPEASLGERSQARATSRTRVQRPSTLVPWAVASLPEPQRPGADGCDGDREGRPCPSAQTPPKAPRKANAGPCHASWAPTRHGTSLEKPEEPPGPAGTRLQPRCRVTVCPGSPKMCPDKKGPGPPQGLQTHLLAQDQKTRPKADRHAQPGTVRSESLRK